MNYEQLYYSIVKEENKETIIKILEEQRIIEQFEVQRVEIHSRNDFPYILFVLDTASGHAAQYLGLFVDIKPILPEYNKEWFYLPVICLWENLPNTIKDFVNIDNTIEHELLHVRSFLKIIQDDPAYPELTFKYGMNSNFPEEDLEKSISLVLEKLFIVEPPALTNDFEKGESFILDQFLGRILQFKCETLEEYLQIKMKDYLSGYENQYKRRFPEAREKIKNLFEKYTAKYGKDILGEDPIKQLQQLRDSYAEKLLDSSLKEIMKGKGVEGDD
ncbi:MAG: hypothetical protein GY754_42580 [bacterium]|nr:hypothetical protein [bacterium]